MFWVWPDAKIELCFAVFIIYHRFIWYFCQNSRIRNITGVLSFKIQVLQMGGRRNGRNFFSLWMWHHTGRPTTDHCAKTIGINCYSPREADDWTALLTYLKIFLSYRHPVKKFVIIKSMMRKTEYGSFNLIWIMNHSMWTVRSHLIWVYLLKLF